MSKKSKTSVDSFYAELHTGHVGSNQQEVLLHMIRRTKHDGATGFTRAEIQKAFNDIRCTYAPRLAELRDYGLISLLGTTTFDSASNKTVVRYAVKQRVLEGDWTVEPFYRMTKASNRAIVTALRNALWPKRADGTFKSDEELAASFRVADLLTSVITRRMGTGTLRTSDSEPVRPPKEGEPEIDSFDTVKGLPTWLKQLLKDAEENYGGQEKEEENPDSEDDPTDDGYFGG